MLIKEMFSQSSYCITFIQGILKLEEKPSDEDFISLSKNCCDVFEFNVPKQEGDPGYFNVLVLLGDAYVGEALRDLGAGSLMPLAIFSQIGGIELYPFKSTLKGRIRPTSNT